MRIVYNSFNGRYSDNPRAIYEALVSRDGADEHLWLADAQHLPSFPAGVATVPIASPGSAAALERADLLVANCHTDLDVWSKRSDTIYLQTWHGTPLKRIHRSAVTTPSSALLDALDADIARWDYLLTPSRIGTNLLRKAFGYTGAVLETGYPRNDILVGPGAVRRRARVRRSLGLADGTVAVLYAPTYRDDETGREDEVPLGLDLSALGDRLGAGHVLLLRLHYFLTHRRRYRESERVRDLSAYPDIADLYLAADVLVTDYSSALFDFAVTGKPIVLFPYDLEHYRARLRGFTLDLHAEAPGPVLRDQRHLAETLRDLPSLVAGFHNQYARFRERYCNLDDGHATERVLARLGR